MPAITYMTSSGVVCRIKVDSGQTLMEGAVRNAVPGIDADCGGACACATCQVGVDPAWIHVVGPPGPAEAEMLEFAGNVAPNARLACQVVVDGRLDGLVVHVPESQ